MTYENKEEWLSRGKELFGDDMLKWRFVCPSCKRVQTAEDFRQFKDKGASPNDAYQQCKGRFTGGLKGPDKCDWAAFGLFRGPNIVRIEGGDDVAVFAFDEEKSND